MVDAELLIVGAGFSGTMLAVHALARGSGRVALIGGRDAAGRGLAYARAASTNFLNVRSGRMSAFPDDPAHFADWLGGRRLADVEGFATRRMYGDYLRSILDAAATQAGERLRVVDAHAVGADRIADGWSVLLDDGRRIAAGVMVLALGNLPPDDLPAFVDLPAGVYRGDAWDPSIADGLRPDDVVVLIGTGLTAIDTMLRLDRDGFTGRIVAMSRRGLTPRAHADGAAHAKGVDALDAMPLSRRLRRVRRRADEIGWRDAVDELRPVTRALWRASTDAERNRFLRHLRPWWDVHRHRVAPFIHERVERMRAAGRLEVVAARPVRTVAADGGARLIYRPRGAAGMREMTARRIVNCTGPSGDIARAADPFLRDLLAKGVIRADLHRLGIDVDDAQAAIARDGSVWADLWAVGPIARGRSWEMTAIPDLRGQAAAMADVVA